jgi:hypothetical protein
MTRKDTESGLLKFLKVLLYDASRRLEILSNEVVHLKLSLEVRGQRTSGTESALMHHLLEAARLLDDECDDEKNESMVLARAFTKGLESALAQSANQLPPTELVKNLYLFALSWRAKLLVKIGAMVERLGNLHDRLEQYTQRSNPDHPEPILRRRSEQGLADRYLNELVRWSHRDLVLLAKYDLGANYPYAAVPLTFQSWGYGNSSSQHTFIRTTAQQQWASRIEDVPTSVISPPIGKFVSIGLTYWQPERMVLHPILAHEIAHQILKDLYGRDINFPLLEQDTSHVGRMLRRLIQRSEIWMFARRNEANLSEAKSLSVEIMADLFAAARFKSAYLYSWLVEVSYNDLANLWKDSYGMLRAVDSTFLAEVNLQEGVELTKTLNAFWKKEIRPVITSELLQTLKPLYLRGVSILKFLDQSNREIDKNATDLREAAGMHLEMLAYVFAEGQPTLVEYLRDMGEEFAQIVVSEPAWKDAVRNDSTNSRVERFTSDLKFLPTKILELTASRRSALEKSKRVQSVSPEARNALLHLFQKTDLETWLNQNDRGLVITAADVYWRLEWGHDERKKHIVDQGQAIRTCIGVLMDDYLTKVAGSVRLLSSVAKTNIADRSTNNVAPLDTLDITILETIFSSQILKEIEGKQDRNYSSSPDASNLNATSLTISVPANWKFTKSTVDLDYKKLNSLKGLVRGMPWSTIVSAAKDGIFYEFRLFVAAASQQQSPENAEENFDTMTSVLLGRYDRLEITQGKHKKSVRPKFPEHSISEVARKKKLLLIGNTLLGPNSSDGVLQKINDAQSLLGVVLISVKFDFARTWTIEALRVDVEHKIRSITEKLPQTKINALMFISDGWEDMVCILHNDTETPTFQDLDHVKEIVTQISRNSFVKKTETLFPDHLLKVISENDKFSIRFGIRGSEALNSIKTRLAKIEKTNYKIWEKAGIEDFEIVCDKNSEAVSIYEALHVRNNYLEAMEIETKIQWLP